MDEDTDDNYFSLNVLAPACLDLWEALPGRVGVSDGIRTDGSIDTEKKCKEECIRRDTCLAVDWFYTDDTCILYEGQIETAVTTLAVYHHFLEDKKCGRGFPAGK